MGFDLLSEHDHVRLGFHEGAATEIGSNYYEVYRFIQNRLAAVRVDMQVQRPYKDKRYLEILEKCTRFEMLSIGLLWSQGNQGKTDNTSDFHINRQQLNRAVDELLKCLLVSSEPSDGHSEKIALLVIYSLFMLQTRKPLSLISLVPKAKRSKKLIWAMEAANGVFNFWTAVPRFFKKSPDVLSKIGLLMPLDVTRQRLVICWLRSCKFFHSANTLQRLLNLAMLSENLPNSPETESDQEEGNPLRRFFSMVSPLPVPLGLLRNLFFIQNDQLTREYLDAWGLKTTNTTVIPPIRKVKGTLSFLHSLLQAVNVSWFENRRSICEAAGLDRRSVEAVFSKNG